MTASMLVPPSNATADVQGTAGARALVPMTAGVYQTADAPALAPALQTADALVPVPARAHRINLNHGASRTGAEGPGCAGFDAPRVSAPGGSEA